MSYRVNSCQNSEQCDDKSQAIYGKSAQTIFLTPMIAKHTFRHKPLSQDTISHLFKSKAFANDTNISSNDETCLWYGENTEGKGDKSTACRCQPFAVGCLIEDKELKLKNGHNSEKKKCILN